MAHELVIEGNVFFKQGLIQCCIGIDDGIISSVKKVLKGEKHIDVGLKLVLPGAIDPHVHFRDPGFTEKEDFRSGTLSAAFGGVTTILDMPNTSPPVTTARGIVDKFEAIRGKAHVDHGLYIGLGPKSDIEKAAPMASAMKIYLGETTGAMLVEGIDVLRKGLAAAASSGLPVSVHCEDKDYPSRANLGSKVPNDTLDHDRSRPEEMEVTAVKGLLSLEEAIMAKVHIAHVSSPRTLDILPQGLTTEVTPSHIFLKASKGLRAKGKINPPLRCPPTPERLSSALIEGRIDMVASDHAPHTEEEKARSFPEAPCGIPGVETMVPLFLRALKNDQIGIFRLVDMTSKRASEVFKLKGKGAIYPGMDADIMTIDMKATTKIKAKDLHSRCNWTPFEGMEAIFPKNVFVRGQWLVQDRELVGGPGFGRPIREDGPAGTG